MYSLTTIIGMWYNWNMSTLQDELNQQKPFPAIEVEVFLNLTRTQAVLARANEALLRAHGLTGALYNVLRILRGANDWLTCSAIAKRMVTRVPDVTRLLDRLVAAGWVKRVRDEEDRRVVLVTLTEAGRALLAELDGPIIALHQAQLAHMPRKDLDALNALLVAARARPAAE